jgi:hypothetical protein
VAVKDSYSGQEPIISSLLKNICKDFNNQNFISSGTDRFWMLSPGNRKPTEQKFLPEWNRSAQPILGGEIISNGSLIERRSLRLT